MTYQIDGLDPAQFTHLIGQPDDVLARHDTVRMTVTARPGSPCRVTLEDAEPGESVLLLNHVSHDHGPYRASHAIFVREGATVAARYVDCPPPVFSTRTLSLRGFDLHGMIKSAALAQPGEADGAIRAMLGDEEIVEVHVHNAARGCFAAKVARA